MSSSSYTLQSVSDIIKANGDTAPALATGGFSQQPLIQVANLVMQAMLLGGPGGQPCNWKFNRQLVTPFPTISWQQDYFVPGVVTLGWLESCYGIQFTNSSQPKPKFPIEVKRDLMVTFQQTGYPGKICQMPNKLLQTGTWGATEISTPTGQNNPGPNVVYTNPLTSISSNPSNPITQITDPNGNFWVLTTFGICGVTQPVWPTSPAFPTLTSPTTPATTVADGTVVWTAINPNGQGFRLNPIPPQQGVVWQINPVGQTRINQFTSPTQSLDPLPDDYYSYFVDGCLCQFYRRNPDPKIRARYKDEWANWLRSLDMAVRQEQREETDFGFTPNSAGVMDTGWGWGYYGPAWPFAGPAGGTW
jgi:hypothetical protein